MYTLGRFWTISQNKFSNMNVIALYAQSDFFIDQFLEIYSCGEQTGLFQPHLRSFSHLLPRGIIWQQLVICNVKRYMDGLVKKEERSRHFLVGLMLPRSIHSINSDERNEAHWCNFGGQSSGDNDTIATARNCYLAGLVEVRSCDLGPLLDNEQSLP